MFTSCLVPQAIALASNVMDKLGEPGQYTLFAPTNDAFDKMNPDYLENIMEDPAVVKGTVKMWCLNESIKYNHNIFTLFLWPGKYAKKKGPLLLWATMSYYERVRQLHTAHSRPADKLIWSGLWTLNLFLNWQIQKPHKKQLICLFAESWIQAWSQWQVSSWNKIQYKFCFCF